MAEVDDVKRTPAVRVAAVLWVALATFTLLWAWVLCVRLPLLLMIPAILALLVLISRIIRRFEKSRTFVIGVAVGVLAFGPTVAVWSRYW